MRLSRKQVFALLMLTTTLAVVLVARLAFF
jgi:hypothetical protein